MTFLDGSTSLGTGALSTASGVTTATLAVTTLAVGSHTITAAYSGDILYLPETSSPITERIVTVDLKWPGAGNALTLTENTAAATPTIIISERRSAQTCWILTWGRPRFRRQLDGLRSGPDLPEPWLAHHFRLGHDQPMHCP